ncbi:hypothetical protein GGI15_000531 [Coemansia interrupta]|uniref:Transcription elongation factor 1 homolog n=1 Tax=Coemansia interrupta TaxID=1126814 RepID=A0A9W8HK52_9FUNG|nr:hypothetical protein GGI15_000531 [Coemansia interrupta]
MGKRKSSRKVVKKERPKLDTSFACLFCNHESSVTVTMDKDHKVGNLRCKICTASYQAAIHHLSAPVDVYSEWIDACEEAKLEEIRKTTAAAEGSSTGGGGGGGGEGGRRGRLEDESSGSERDVGRSRTDRYGVQEQLSDSELEDY